MVNRERLKKILILTLYSGENELAESLEVLSKQTYTNWEHKIISSLPNKEAHETLYFYIMSQSSGFDLFIKLDADMVLIGSDALASIVRFFASNPNVDQANFAVHDVLSDSRIMGLLVFSNKAKWFENRDDLFVDHTPVIPGKRLLIWGTPAPVALHCPNPHSFQAFHFGAHRAMKALQRNRTRKNWIQSALQWHLLMQVWRRFLVQQTRELGLFMLGAYSVWRGEIDGKGNEYQNASLKKAYDKYEILDSRSVLNLLREEWACVLAKHDLLYVFLWPRIKFYKFRSRISVWLNKAGD